MVETKDLKVIGSMIFAGSASIGVMRNGVTPKMILEISDEILEDNASHFIHNYPNIPVLGSSVWEAPGYLEKLREENIDLIYGNPPCSGLSLGVRGPQSHEKGPNCHQYRYMEIIKQVQPKAFMYENAPTLVSTGKPILNDFIKTLENYNFTIIRDFGMNHGVPMKRQRTFFIGWRKDVFPTIPTLTMDKQDVLTTVGDAIKDLYDVPLNDPSVLNHNLIPDRPFQSVEKFFPDVPYGNGSTHTVNWIICNEYEKYEPLLDEKTKKALKTQLWKQREGLGYWDKSSTRPDPNKLAPSLTGYTSLIHPIHHRQFTVREYARLMGYPDEFEFLVPKRPREIVRHIAQGVPVPFFQWASGNVIEAIKGNRPSKDPYADTRVVLQHHTKELARSFTTDEFLNTKEIAKFNKKDEKVWELTD